MARAKVRRTCRFSVYSLSSKSSGVTRSGRIKMPRAVRPTDDASPLTRETRASRSRVSTTPLLHPHPLRQDHAHSTGPALTSTPLSSATPHVISTHGSNGPRRNCGSPTDSSPSSRHSVPPFATSLSAQLELHPSAQPPHAHPPSHARPNSPTPVRHLARAISLSRALHIHIHAIISFSLISSISPSSATACACVNRARLLSEYPWGTGFARPGPGAKGVP